MVSPICTPIASDADAVPQRITGLLSTVSGRNGSAARVSRQPNSSDSTNEAPISIRIGGDSHGSRVPPQVSASSSGMAEPIISPAPSTSSLWRRSWRGMRLR